MTIDSAILKDIIDRAWEESEKAVNDSVIHETAGDQQKVHSSRSEVWVDVIAKGFQRIYPTGQHRVFWKGNYKNQSTFRKNEFLFDITVARIEHSTSIEHRPKCLEFVSGCEWIVESEFAEDTREIVIDMSKLVIGAAKNKLMIASQRGDDKEKKLLSSCSKIAECCGVGNVYFCFVEHPRNWRNNPKRPKLYYWDVRGNWLLTL